MRLPYERRRHEAKPNEISLLQAYEACKDFISIPDFFDRIVELVDINMSSWAHLITIYGIEPIRNGGEYHFDFDDIKKILSNHYNKIKLTADERKKIGNVSFSLNASAYIYLRRLLPHFEYMSAYKTKESEIEWESIKPLFQLTNFNIKKMEWEFQIKLNDVFKHVSTYRANTENYFRKTFPQLSKGDYVKSNYVFKGDPNNHYFVKKLSGNSSI